MLLVTTALSGLMAGVIQTAPRTVFTASKTQGDVQRILELYRRSGRFQASVTPQIIELPNNRVNLVFVIAEGPNTGVASINFIGNQAFGDQRLRNVVSAYTLPRIAAGGRPAPAQRRRK